MFCHKDAHEITKVLQEIHFTGVTKTYGQNHSSYETSESLCFDLT